MSQPFQLEPALPPHLRKTYSASTRLRKATCADADCDAYLHGWVTTVDETTELGQRQAHYIRHDTRRHTEQRGGQFGGTVIADTLTCFVFEPGQRCFRSDDHRVPDGRAALYVVRGGDHRGNPRGEHYQHSNQDSWLDDFATHQDRLAAEIRKG